MHGVLDKELDRGSPEQPHASAKSAGSSRELRTQCWREEGSRRHFHHLLIAALQGAIAAQTETYASEPLRMADQKRVCARVPVCARARRLHVSMGWREWVCARTPMGECASERFCVQILRARARRLRARARETRTDRISG